MQEIAEILTGKEFLLNGIKSPLKSRNSFPDIGYKHLPYTPRSEEPIMAVPRSDRLYHRRQKSKKNEGYYFKVVRNSRGV
ncbi:hypothetical protein CKA32_006564 [Geitlerinema sp. FC II]|nr:hypothetical protein CKA32_006564 [Geitlerinema sp. FC II]